MPNLSIMSDVQPRWTKQGAHWIKSYPSSPSIQTSSARSSMETKSAPLDTEVLLKIMNVLQKLDLRLEVMESTSPISNTGNILVDSPISRKQSAHTAGSKRTLVHCGEIEDINDYARSIAKLGYAIDEVVSSFHGDQTAYEDGSNADVGVIGSEEANEMTSDLLGSRMSSDVLRQNQALFTTPNRNPPPSPHSSLSQHDPDDSQSLEIEEQPRSPIEQRNAVTASNPQSVLPVEPVLINTKENKTSPVFLKIEIGFYAYNGWKQGVVSKISNEFKAFRKDEKNRFKELRNTHRAKDTVQRLIDKLGSAMEKEWRDEKEMVNTIATEGEAQGCEDLWMEICYFVPKPVQCQPREF